MTWRLPSTAETCSHRQTNKSRSYDSCVLMDPQTLICIKTQRGWWTCRQYMYILQVRISTSGVVIHYVGWSCQSTNPQAIHCFKWEFCVQFAQRFSGTYPWRTAGPACIWFIMCRMFLVLFRQLGQLYPIESIHLPAYAVTAVVPSWIFCGYATISQDALTS